MHSGTHSLIFYSLKLALTRLRSIKLKRISALSLLAFQVCIGAFVSTVAVVPPSQAQSIFSWFSSNDNVNKPQDLLSKDSLQTAAEIDETPKQVAAFGELVYQYFQEDYQQVLLLIEVGSTQHGFSLLSKDDTDRLRLMQGAAQLHLGLYQQSQANFSQLLSETTSPYVQANTWFFMAKAGFQNKQTDIVETAYLALQKNALREHLAVSQYNELLYLSAYVRMQVGQQWQTLHNSIPNESIYKAYLLANYATILYNQANYAQATEFFIQAKQALLAVQNRKRVARSFTNSVFESITWFIRPWRWFDNNAISEQSVNERQAKYNIEEQDALFDRINIGLGQSLLQQNDLENAIAVIQNIADGGADSQQALLTYGWANAKQNRWQTAMSAWQYLQQNSVGLYALQASYGLAYAFAQQDNLGQAFYALQSTAKQIDDNLLALNVFAKSVQQDNFFNLYHNQWPDDLSDLKLGFFAPTQDFDATFLLSMRQQALAILKDINTKQSRVAQLDTMLQEREQTHRGRSANMTLRTAQVTLQRAQQYIDDTHKLISQADTFDEQLALSKKMSTADTSEHFTRLSSAQTRHARLVADSTSARPLKASYAKRLALIEGILTWQLMDDFVVRKWQHEKLLIDAQTALTAAQNQYAHLQSSAQKQDPYLSQRTEFTLLNDAFVQQTQAAKNVYDNATNALTSQLLHLINTRKIQLQEQGVNTRLSMLRIQDLQQQGVR